MSQLELFIWNNSFKVLFKEKYASLLPKRPGIYQFYDTEKNLLYVGKSKCLADRVRSYTHHNPTKSSKRLVQLTQQIHTVDWIETKNEKQALLLENEWLRSKKPPFNSANTKPELHVFVGLKKTGNLIELGWTLSEDYHPFDTLFGAFKGLSITFSLLQALRILAVLIDRNQGLSKILLKKKPPSRFVWSFESEHQFGLDFLEDIFNGKSVPIGQIIHHIHLASCFEERVFEKALTTVLSWFQKKALLNRGIKNEFNFKSDLVTKESIDDWVVKLKFEFMKTI